MKWKKHGLIYNPSGNLSWAKTHAAVPLSNYLEKNLYRIYFTMRDSENRASMAYLELDISNPTKINYVTKTPVLSPGKLGTFDDSGTTASSIVEFQNKKYLYYIGWNKGVSVPYHTSIGLAISDDGGNTFEKYSTGPIMERNSKEPHFCSNPFVLIEDNQWKMWYISFIRWEIYEGKPRPYYHIKYAESENGIDWNKTGKVCIDFKNENEWAISRPCVIKENGMYKMWYSYRADGPYRIGYAESSDGLNWNRLDEKVGIDLSESGWDSEMIEFPYVFNHGKTKYLLYCGNGFGKTGFGYATLELE